MTGRSEISGELARHFTRIDRSVCRHRHTESGCIRRGTLAECGELARDLPYLAHSTRRGNERTEDKFPIAFGGPVWRRGG